ncbi:MAG: sugar ABC transporter permease [Bifidobacterium scardovii]|uniref:carbohydrate ABC transporter permease n=4 Tax=Bifidobacterium scardovii TaxID=158787 RepID=UPI0006653A07|nr:sugar ABC transporter permease [Bifidobacterium scardovii]MBS6947962.1 sugar ABC transporter permease [Bifidobacterium scardovii]MDU3737392.1 sugar ABC transporter permease [Bifidobacterium scardovii]MDU5612044.1 sugar ABC transporter permease [Bifidobacterium scardovii]MDU6283110.1 sugar ABC transporter permease [Bifidobacterium scardovii]
MRDFAKRYWTVLPAIILLCVFMVGPILWAFYGSMTNMSLTGATATDTSFIGLENYQKLFTDKSFPQSVWLTVIFVLISAIIAQNFLGMAVAVLLSRANRTVGQFVSVSVISAWVLPEMVAGFACYAFFSKNGTLNQVLGLFGLGNTEWLYTFPMFAVILANIWRGTAFSMMNYQAAIGEVDRSLTEAAVVDGANAWQAFIHVTIPVIKQTIMTNLMLITLQTMSAFTLIFVMTAGGPGDKSSTLPIFAYKAAFKFGDIGYGSAIAVVMLAIGAIFGLVYVRALKDEKGITNE